MVSEHFYIWVMILQFVPVLSVIFLGIMSPGPSFVITAQTALTQGRKNGFALALGLACASLVIFSFFQLGFTFIFNIHPLVRPTLQIIGGLYLVFLGMQMLRHAKAVYTGKAERAPDISTQKRQSWKTGFLTQITNPKTFFVYMSAYTSFFPHSVTGWQFMIFLSCIFCLEMGWYSLVVSVLSAPKPRAAFLKRSHIVNAVCGTIILLLGGRLLIEIF